MNQATTLQSHIAGRWLGSEPASALRSAINGATVAHTHAEAIDFAEAVHHARKVGLPGLMALDFQQRAERLKALAKYLNEHKEALYAISAHTGATRADSWIDIEGGTGTLFAYASMGANELPSGNLVRVLAHNGRQPGNAAVPRIQTAEVQCTYLPGSTNRGEVCFLASWLRREGRVL